MSRDDAKTSCVACGGAGRRPCDEPECSANSESWTMCGDCEYHGRECSECGDEWPSADTAPTTSASETATPPDGDNQGGTPTAPAHPAPSSDGVCPSGESSRVPGVSPDGIRWHWLDRYFGKRGVSKVMAAATVDGLGVIASWHKSHGVWLCDVVDMTAAERMEHSDGDEVVPMEPPAYLLTRAEPVPGPAPEPERPDDWEDQDFRLTYYSPSRDLLVQWCGYEHCWMATSHGRHRECGDHSWTEHPRDWYDEHLATLGGDS